MSGVLAILDFASGEWSFDVDEQGEELDVRIGFTYGGGPTEFDDLAFGWSIGDHVETYPKQGVSYLATDQEFVEAALTFVEYDVPMVFSVWAENGGVRYDSEIALTAIPPQPYPSWTYGPDGWEAPEPWPGVEYGWHEATLSWVFSPYPEDGDVYAWNPDTATWDAVG